MCSSDLSGLIGRVWLPAEAVERARRRWSPLERLTHARARPHTCRAPQHLPARDDGRPGAGRAGATGPRTDSGPSHPAFDRSPARTTGPRTSNDSATTLRPARVLVAATKRCARQSAVTRNTFLQTPAVADVVMSRLGPGAGRHDVEHRRSSKAGRGSAGELRKLTGLCCAYTAAYALGLLTSFRLRCGQRSLASSATQRL